MQFELNRRKVAIGAATAVALVAGLFFSAPVAAAAAAEPRVVAIGGNDSMQFTVKRIDAKAGEKLKIVLSATGSMPKAEMAHNWVLLAKGIDASSFAMAAAMARDTGYIPAAKKSQILAMTPGLIGAGEKAEVVFDVPKEPGEYTYICTFPGHYIGGMKGVLVVK
jgi:azurin